MKHIELFKDGFDSTVQEKIQPENWPYVGRDMVTGEIVYTEVSEPVIGPADNEIWYTSTDGNVVNPTNTSAFGVNIVSNTYENGKGVITFDGDVIGIGEGAFFECYNLTSVTIPNSVTSIVDSAFSNCIGLTSITIPNSVTSIIGNAFTYCQSLTSIAVNSGNTNYDSRNGCNAIIETLTNTLIAGCQNTIIPNSVTSIGPFAFADCSSLASITIPNSVTSIGDRVFWGCSSLTSITIPNSVTSIGDWAFAFCSGLTAVTIPNSVTSIVKGTFRNCGSLTSITIPNSVTSIGDYAFRSCSALTSITFEGTMEEWNSIEKGYDWNYEVLATYVQCSDGDVTL